MIDKFFNVIVPTRERADTLASTLKALVAIDYPRLKIVVCDNASLDNTREIVEGFRDERIHYSRSPERLSMAQNWQRGLSFIDEGYVTYLGDDDALLIGAIPQINTILNDKQFKAIAWDKIEYLWPSCTNEAVRGHMHIPLSNRYEILSGSKVRSSVKKMDLPYTRLPSLYNSFVDVGLVKSLNKGKPFYQGALAPDLYSGIAFSYHVGDYMHSRRPFSINGASAHSGGTSYMTSKDKSAAIKFLSEIDIQIDDRLILGPSMVIAIAVEYWNVYKHFGYGDSFLDINEIVSKAKEELLHFNGDRYADVYSLLKGIIEKNKLSLSILDGLPDSVPEVIATPVLGFDSSSNVLYFDSRKIGVRDVYEAAKVAELFLPRIEKFRREESPLRKARRVLKRFRKSLIRKIDRKASVVS